MSDIFVSYKREDQKRVAKLVRALETAGFKVWWDCGLPGGESWRANIEAALGEARSAVAVWTKASVGRDAYFVRDEAARALKRDILISVLLDRVEVPIGFGEVQAVELVRWRGNADSPHFRDLVSAVRAKLDNKPAPTAIGRASNLTQRSRFGIMATVALLSGLFAVAVLGILILQLRHTPERSVSQSPFVSPTHIAVLPFVNMSGDPARDYFSDGISEELLDDLARLSTLRVAARTSSFSFKGTHLDIKTIARLLSVGSVLEGSVRESGQHLRISGELIDAENGYRLWSGTYDRDFTDVLVVEEQIARAITVALTKQILPRGAGLPAVRRINSDAYRAFLLGKRQLESRTANGANAAISSFKTTVSLAPNFADGYAALADANIILADKLQDRGDLISSAETASNNALRLDPRNVGALSAHLDISLHRLDWSTAISDARKLRGAAPNSAKVLHEMFRYFDFMDFPDLALAAVKGAAWLDPLSFVDRFNTAAFLLHDARFPEAVQASTSALALRPHHPVALAILCVAAANAGQLPLAHKVENELSHSDVNRSRRSEDDAAEPLCASAIDIAEHRWDDAKRIIDKLAQGFPQSGVSASELGDKYAIIGEIRKADFWFTRSYDNREFRLFLLPSDRLVPDSFRDTPQYKALLDRPLFRDWSRAHEQLASDLAAR